MRSILLVALAGPPTLACTPLDALTGSEPDLPWSADAPRGPLSRAEAGLYAATTSVVDGALELATDLPRAPGECQASHPAALCADRDHDGLTDEWEDVVLDRLRPFVRIDAGDPLRIDGEGVVGSIGRVARSLDSITEEPRIRVLLVLGYSRDYGRCTFGSHRGDSERVALDLAPLPGEAGSVRVVGAYTAGHEGTVNDSSQRFRAGELSSLEYARDPVTGEARWAVYSSRSKHATYATPELCESNDSWLYCGDEDCAAGRSVDPPNELLMAVVNAGEPGARLVEEFMGESVWEDSPFCGGVEGSEPCASPIVEKLRLDPFGTR